VDGRGCRLDEARVIAVEIAFRRRQHLGEDGVHLAGFMAGRRLRGQLRAQDQVGGRIRNELPHQPEGVRDDRHQVETRMAQDAQAGPLTAVLFAGHR
jgi:hypothetical protein